MSAHIVAPETTTSTSLLAKFRALRSERGTTDTRRTNTKDPIFERADQAKIQSHIDKTCPKWVSIFMRVSVATGWRTSDVCRLRYSDIDFTTGQASITVSKQTKAAESRAYGKAVEAVRMTRKREALAAGDAVAYMRLDGATRDEITASMTDAEQEAVGRAVESAPIKRDTKHLPKGLLATLAAMRDKNHHDDNVFSRHATDSNRARNMEGSISRQSVWVAFRKVFTWYAAEVGRVVKLSAYSLRKSFAVNLLRGIDGKGNNLAEVCSAFGHSSIAMTMKYLGLASSTEQLQRSMVESIG